MLHLCRNRCRKMATTQNNPLYSKVLQDSKMPKGSKGSAKTARTVVSTARGLCKMPGLDLRQICAIRSICIQVSLFVCLALFSNTVHFCLLDPFQMFLEWICFPFDPSALRVSFPIDFCWFFDVQMVFRSFFLRHSFKPAGFDKHKLAVLSHTATSKMSV